MPSSTPKQERTMAAAAHDPKFAAKVGIPVAVAQEFNAADVAQHEGPRGPDKLAAKPSSPRALAIALSGKHRRG